ncbi:MAG: hypothetical protein AABZ80_00420 [Gemmatimonadota bacterium]
MRTRKAVGILIAVGALVAACARLPQANASTASFDALVVDGVIRLRAATRAYQSLDSAVAAGYPKTVAQCLVHEHHGAMGYHHVNRDHVDAKLEIEKPEILLYERLEDGAYHLNGVEYIVPFAAWSRDSTPPTLMGRKMMREDNLKIWYTHVWAWTDNKDGLFANFNPSVQCLGADRKVYTPTVDTGQ